MAVGEIVQTTYGLGGYDPSKPHDNVVEVEVVTAESAADQTISVRDGAGAELRTRTRRRDVAGENDTTIRDQARNALAANRTFINLASPSNAQNAAQVKALTRQINGVIRLLLGALDGTD